MAITVNQQTPEPVSEGQMTLIEHLNELRVRLIWIISSLLLGTVAAFFFRDALLTFLQAPLGSAPLISTGPTDTVVNVFKISFMVGASIAMPVIVYQLIAFAAPGLYAHEKRALFLTLPAIMVLFVGGMAFAFYVMLPVAIQFLQTFAGTHVEQLWTLDRYVGFVTQIVFWIGVSFETPVVLGFLSRTGIVSGPQLLNFWRYAIVIIAVISAIITPTIDPVNMALVMAPLIFLYFVSVGLGYLLYKPRMPRDFLE